MEKFPTGRVVNLSSFGDVVALNAFVASRPDVARIFFSVTDSAWQLEIEDVEGGERWVVGGSEGKPLYNIKPFYVTIRRVWRGYIGNNGYVVRLRGGYIIISLNDSREEIVFTAPQACGRTDPLREPVYIWHLVGYNILDCGSGLTAFETREKFEEWVRANEERVTRWPEWYVVPVADYHEEWLTAIRRAELGPPYPAPEEVIELAYSF